MGQMQQQIVQITNDLSQLKVHVDIGTASTTDAIAQLGLKLTGSDTAAAIMKSHLKQLYKVGDEVIMSTNTKIAELTISRPERPEHKWHFTRPKDLAPTVLAKEEEWKRWKEDIEDYVDAVTPGMKEILKMVGASKDEIEQDWFAKN